MPRRTSRKLQPEALDWRSLRRVPFLSEPLSATTDALEEYGTGYDLDAVRYAKILLERHGPEAEIDALVTSVELGATGDHAGRRAWMRIALAIEELKRTTPRPGESLH